MSPERFLEQFGYMADAPNGITKLRELILQLAVRGKLVAQNPNDEPASVLLERIAAEKERLVKEGEIKKGKPVPAVNLGEVPFELPEVWEWVRFGSITSKIGSGSTPRGGKNAYVDRGVVFLRSQNVWNQGLNLSDVAFIPDQTHAKMANTHVNTTDILLNITGASLGRCALVPPDLGAANVSQHVTIIRPVVMGTRNYLHKCLLSPYVQQMVWGRQVGMAREGLSKKVLEQFEVPLPPIQEQQRIVAKVDQLMALCDELEAKRNQRTETHSHLIRAAHQPLTQPRDHAEFQTAWQRIRDNFDRLHSTIGAFKALRQTILQLAVQGRLVPQDPNDESASVLLEKIKAEKERLVAEGKIKKTKPLPAVDPEEVPYELPVGWEWSRLHDAIDVRDGTHDSPKDSDEPDAYPLITSKDFRDEQIDFASARRISASDHMEISKRSLVEVDDILFSMIGGNIGNQVMVNDERPFSVKNVALFKYYDKKSTSPLFIRMYLEDVAYTLQTKASGGAQPFVSLGALRKLVIGLPPIAEQHRIVVKVKQLMALCDELGAKIQANNDTAQHFAEAVVAELAA